MIDKVRSLKKPKLYYLKWVWNNYKPRLPMVLLLVLMTVLSTTVSVLYPIVYKYILDGLVGNLKLFEQGKLSMDAVMADRLRVIKLLLCLGVGLMISNFYPFLRGRMNLVFEMAFREKFFAEILQKNYRFFLRYRTGDIVTRLTEDLRSHQPGIAWFICSGIFRGFNSACIILFCLISMMTLSVKLALLSIVPIPFMFLFFIKLETVIESRYKKYQECMSETNDFLESAYAGIKIVKSFNAEASQADYFAGILGRRMDLQMKLIRINGLFMVYFEFMNYLGQVMVLLFGGMMVIRGEISVGTYYAFYSYLGMIVWPLLDIPTLFVTAAQSFVAIDRLDDMEEFEADHPDYLCGERKIDRIESLEFRNVGFAYPAKLESSDPKKKGFGLKSVSFEVKKGEKVAIVGKIGSGKTTVLNLFCGFLNPDSGEILINGIPVSALEKENFRSLLGYVQQEPNIFSESIRTNIDFWRNKTEQEIKGCAGIAQFHEEVEKFPGKYDELIGQRGTTLSGGQRQRLSIARALAGKPQLFLMDDVTSSLDAENEQQFWRSMSQEFPEITSLIVTHRLSTAQRADRIVVLTDGAVEAIGNHAELIEKSATYRELISK
ncbi:MAG: ABC transporter ATP-binding protein [Candidatus Wallbacteria bacterium]|nr:ABC transporter ATP-binding protein [Candidatus Wallbacteria bacterium]